MPSPGPFHQVAHWAALAAAIISAALLVYLIGRAPRNLFTLFLGGMLAAIAEWNIFEFLDYGMKSWQVNVQFLGIIALPTLLFHFAMRLIDRDRRRLFWVRLLYTISGGFLFLTLGTLVSDDLNRFFWSPAYNAVFISCFAPFLVASLAILARYYLASPPETAGLYGYPLLGGGLLFLSGCLELAMPLGVNAPPMANLGGLATSILIFISVVRYRDVYDSISRLRRRTSGMLGSMQMGLISFDANRKVLYSNELATRLLEKKPESWEDVGNDLDALFEKGGARYAKRGTRILKIHTVRDESVIDELARIQCLIQDATEEYQLLHEFAQRESLASLGEAAATLAHEIRNPMTSIRAALESVSAKTGPDADSLNLIRSEFNRLSDVVERGLDYSRPLVADRETCDVNDLIEKVVERAPEKGLVKTNLEKDLPAAYADPDLIGQVLMNLLRNAAEAGTDRIEVSTTKNTKHLLIRIRNSGSPIPPDVLGRLFQPFVTTKSTGTGLGLALCRKILTAHGGQIRAGNVDGGVEFEVELPWTS